ESAARFSLNGTDQGGRSCATDSYCFWRRPGSNPCLHGFKLQHCNANAREDGRAATPTLALSESLSARGKPHCWRSTPRAVALCCSFTPGNGPGSKFSGIEVPKKRRRSLAVHLGLNAMALGPIAEN